VKSYKRFIAAISMTISLMLVTGITYARDLGVFVLPIHKGSLTSSLVYEHVKQKDDFKTRGRSTFKGQVVGALFSYGVTDTVSVAVKGGTIIEPRVEAQGDVWESRAGYLYGIDLYNEVFPATELRPGVQLQAGVTGFQVPLDRADINNSGMTPIDQKMSGVEYHGSVVASYILGRTQPYAGLRGFGNTIQWRDHSAVSGPDHITGHAHGNISVVVGVPVRLSKDVRVVLEGRFVSETAISAGFTIASF
jgi:hypothetical protein